MAQLAPRFGVFLIPQSRLFLFRQGKELGYRQPAQERIVAAQGAAFRQRVKPGLAPGAQKF